MALKLYNVQIMQEKDLLMIHKDASTDTDVVYFM